MPEDFIAPPVLAGAAAPALEFFAVFFAAAGLAFLALFEFWAMITEPAPRARIIALDRINLFIFESSVLGFMLTSLQSEYATN